MSDNRVKSAVRNAQALLLKVAPLHGAIVANTRLEWRDDLPAPAATDGVRILLHPAMMADLLSAGDPVLAARQAAFVLAHEAEHILRRFFQRVDTPLLRKAIPDQQTRARLMNIVQDMVINASVSRLHGVEAPVRRRLTLDDLKAILQGGGIAVGAGEKALWQDSLEGRSEETVLQELADLLQNCPCDAGGGGEDGDEGDEGDASGAGAAAGGGGAGGDEGDASGAGGQDGLDERLEQAERAGGLDHHMEPAGDSGEAEAGARQLVQRALQQLRASGAKRRGVMPLGLEHLLEDGLPQPRLDWRKVLARFLSEAVSGTADWDPTQPDRLRMAQGSELLGFGEVRRGVARLAVCIDTSGSMSQDELATALAELKNLLRRMPPDEVVVIQCDAEVQQVETIRFGAFRPDQVQKIAGGGGTAFAPALKEALRHRAEAIVCFTDGWGDNPPKPPVPVIWLLTSGDHCSAGFGTRVVLK